MVELPERKVEETIGAIDEEGFFARTVRHLQQVVVSYNSFVQLDPTPYYGNTS
jgi:hypothetical protein